MRSFTCCLSIVLCILFSGSAFSQLGSESFSVTSNVSDYYVTINWDIPEDGTCDDGILLGLQEPGSCDQNFIGDVLSVNGWSGSANLAVGPSYNMSGLRGWYLYCGGYVEDCIFGQLYTATTDDLYSPANVEASDGHGFSTVVVTWDAGTDVPNNEHGYLLSWNWSSGLTAGGDQPHFQARRATKG